MLSFYELLEKLTESDINPAPMHSNQTRNKHVVDYGSHIDRKLDDKIKGISMRPDGMERGSGEVAPVKGTLGQISKMQNGETARIIYNLVTRNPQKYNSAMAFPLEKLVEMLQGDQYYDKGQVHSLRGFDPKSILVGIHILTKKVSVPLFEAGQDNKGKYLISVKHFQADASKVQTPSAATKQIALNPDEDQLAKPGGGERYKGIQTNMKPTDKSAADVQIGKAMQQAKANFDKTHDIAGSTGANAAMNQAVNSYKQALQQALTSPGVSPQLKQQAQSEMQRIGQAHQSFNKQWPEAQPSVPTA